MSKISNNSSLQGDNDYLDELEEESQETNEAEPSKEASKDEPRKTITIYNSEFLIWARMKEKGQTWTGLLKMVRKGYDMYIKILSNHAVIAIPSNFPQPQLKSLRPPSRAEKDFELNLNSDRTQRFGTKDPDRRAILKEIKSYKDIRSILKPLPEEELKKIQKSSEYLAQKAKVNRSNHQTSINSKDIRESNDLLSQKNKKVKKSLKSRLKKTITKKRSLFF